MVQPSENNYLATNFFQLKITRLPLVEYYCQSVNLPSLTIQTQELPVAGFGVPIKTPVGRFSYENLTISFLVDEKMKNWLEVYNWMNDLATSEEVCESLEHTNQGSSGKFSDAQLLIMDGSYRKIKTITIKDMYPVGISGIQFSSIVVDTEPVMASVTFAFTSYKIST
jgi:hypothetical protein